MILTKQANMTRQEFQGKPVSYPVQSETTCMRCGGLLVRNICIDLVNSAGDLECDTRRCVQCGDIVDAVILRNRLLNHHMSRTQTKGGAASLTNVHVAA